MNQNGNIIVRAGIFTATIMGMLVLILFLSKKFEATHSLQEDLTNTGLVSNALKFSKHILPFLKSGNLSIQLAAKMVRDKDWATAEELYEQVLASEPGNVSIINNLAYIAQEEGQLDKAIGYAKKGITADPKCAECFNNLGSVLYRQGKRDEAKAQFEQSAKLDPGLLDPCLNLGVLYEDASDWKQALAWYKKAEATTGEPGVKSAIQNRTAWLELIAHSAERGVTSQPK